MSLVIYFVASVLGISYGSRMDPVIWLMITLCFALGVSRYSLLAPTITATIAAVFYSWLYFTRFGNIGEWSWILTSFASKILLCYIPFAFGVIVARLMARRAPSPPEAATSAAAEPR